MVKLDMWFGNNVNAETKKNMSASKPGGIQFKQMEGPKDNMDDPDEEPNDGEEEPLNVNLGILKDVGDEE